MKHRLKIFFISCLLPLTSFVNAQNNLIPNWSFETIQNFPPSCALSGNETITDAVGWTNPNNATPSLFNQIDTIKCSGDTFPFLGVPSNIGGWQYAHTGKGYASIDVLDHGISVSGTYREYVQTKLIDSLRKNKTYCMSFYVSLMDSYATYASSRVGCYFSQNSVSNTSQYVINVSPQVENPYGNILNNYTGWTSVQGTFTANGGENYITIGNFYDDANTDAVFSPNTGSLWCCAPNNYLSCYYLDDVSVVECSAANAGNDTNVCKGANVVLGTNSAFGTSYNWYLLNGDTITHGGGITVTPTVTTTYVLQKQQCGIYSYDTVTVQIKPSYTAHAGKDTTICIGGSALIGTSNLCAWCSYNWQPAQNQSSQVLVYPLVSTTYSLSLKDSCFTTYSNITVNVDYCQSPIVVVPNIFTPNADGINDAWQPIIQNPLSILNYQCTIYDRWGIKVFNIGMLGETWDGHTTSGLACTEGTYYYVITYTDAKTNTQKQAKGFIELAK